MVALARNLDFAGSCALAGFTAVLLARLHLAPAWNMSAFVLLNRRHRKLLIL
jgi:hypothetical protein